MNKRKIYTSLKARLQAVNENTEGQYNWVFLPGGPGLGSESLSSLTRRLSLPGVTWHFDFPGDGSNLTSDDNFYFARWQDALIEAVKKLDNVILIGHSTGGMYIQSTPELEGLVIGLVLMGSAPNVNWREQFNAYMQANPIPGIEKRVIAHANNPTDETLKQLTIATISYSVTKKGEKAIIEELKTWPFNNAAATWSDEHFDPTYAAKWIPKEITTLIFAGSEDHIIPLSVFMDLPEYRRKNIVMHEIPQAGHFPWIENPQAVCEAFNHFIIRLKQRGV